MDRKILEQGSFFNSLITDLSNLECLKYEVFSANLLPYVLSLLPLKHVINNPPNRNNEYIP